MVGEVTIMLGNMFAQLLALFERIFTELDGWAIWLGAFLIFTISRMLIVPILGGVISAGQSDMVQKIRNNSKENKVQVVSGLEGAKKKNG